MKKQLSLVRHVRLTQLGPPAATISSPSLLWHRVGALQQSFNLSTTLFPLAALQETTALHELIKSTPLNLALKHDPSFVQDGPTTLPIVAPKHTESAPVHEPSLQTTKRTMEERRRGAVVNK